MLDTLSERGPHAAYHIGGGEPFLDLPRLRRAVAGMRARGLRLDYVETNASWARDEAHATDVLRDLAAVGLGCVLVSLSPFHAEHVPLRRTQTLIRVAERVLPGGAFVWLPTFLDDLAGFPPDRRVDFDALIAQRGHGWALGVADRYHLVLGGRAGDFAAQHGAERPWRQAAAAAPCRHRLTDTSHFHVDLAGAYVPGLCAGLVLPLDEVPGRVDLTRYPVLAALVEGGPAAVVALAAGDGYEPRATYASACHLCTDVRRFLFARGYPELGPPGFYDPLSWRQGHQTSRSST